MGCPDVVYILPRLRIPSHFPFLLRPFDTSFILISALFLDSGHSGQLENPNSDEEDGMDECEYSPSTRSRRSFTQQRVAVLVPVDYAQHPETHVKKRVILDNKLLKMLVDPLPVGASLTAIFDSCHSGTLLDLDHYLCNNVYYPWTNVGRRRYMTKWLNVRRKDGQREYPVRSRGSF